ncbi:MAG: FadD3 family acyl-CoA ligase [Actinomycetota bacterium]
MSSPGSDVPTPSTLLREVASREASAPAFVDGERTVTYGEWDSLADNAAGALRRRGAVKGDVAALLLPNGIEYAVWYLGAIRAGCITTGINMRYGSLERDHILSASGAKLIVSSGESLPSHPAFDDEVRTAGDALAIVFTSGTTGVPKGATYTAGALHASRTMEIAIDDFAGARTIGAIPMPHVQYMTKIGSLIERAACTVFLPGPWSAEITIDAIDRHRITHLNLVPTQLSLMLANRSIENARLSSLRSVTLGGAPVSPDLVRAGSERLGVPILVRYSCTEVSIATGTRPGDEPDGTVGSPFPGVDVRILTNGEIALRSPAMMRGYWNGVPGIDEEGFFSPGDLGELSPDGRLRVNGRAKEMYIRGGYNVYPAEVESALQEHPDVTLVAVAGEPDEVLGERGVAWIVARDPAQPPSLDSVRAFLKGKIAGYKLPDRLEVRSALPMTPMMKVDKSQL